MNNILALYSSLYKSKQRFIDEVFESEVYKAAIPQLTILDLGAYEGEFSFYCLNFAKKIYAVEPDPGPYKVLSSRVEKYNLGNKIKIFPIAIGGKSRDRILYASGFGGSRLLPDDDDEHGDDKKVKVSTLSLVDFFKKNRIKEVDILKIDVEGAEKEIFEADDFPLVADKIKLIIGEVHSSADDVRDTLKRTGFKVKEVGSGVIMATRK